MTSEVSNFVSENVWKHKPRIQIIYYLYGSLFDGDDFYVQEVHRILRGIKMSLWSSFDQIQEELSDGVL